MTTNARSLVVGVFTDHYEAQRALDALQRAGFGGDQIGFMERDSGDVPASQPGAGIALGAGTSTATGTAAVVPKVGPDHPESLTDILGQAWARLTGSATRDANKLKDDLVNMGVPEGEADYYQNEFDAGRTIVMVRTSDRYEDAVGILRENGAYDVNTRGGA